MNMKFTPSNFSGPEGTLRLMQIIRSLVLSKVLACSVNSLNKETLLAAQKDLKKYCNLVVHIAGYSAYFVDSTPMQQAEIIARTEEHI